MGLKRQLRETIVTRVVAGGRILASSRSAFLLIMVIAAAAKLFISAVAPASYDLRDIVAFVGPANPIPYGPWMSLEYQIFLFWRSLTSSTMTANAWAMTPPPEMSTNLQLLSLLLRAPSLSVDVGTAIMLYFMVASVASISEARLAALLWFLNPYTIFAVELLGVPDIAVAFLTVCAIACLVNKRPIIVSFLLLFAVATAIKLYPILLLPSVLIYLKRRSGTLRTMILVMVAGIVGVTGYVAWAFPGGAANLFLYAYTPVTQPLSLYLPYEPTFVRISAATVFLILLYFATWYFAKGPNITNYILPVLLVYFTFSFLYPQYLIWALPFLTLDIVIIKRRRVLLLALLLSFVFLDWLLRSGGLPTPSGYSLLMFPLIGKNLPWFSKPFTSFLGSNVIAVLLLPVVEATMYAIAFVYAFEIIRGWFTQSMNKGG